MSDENIIRPAEPHDLAEITAIYDHYVRHGTASFELNPPGLEEMTERWRRTTQGGDPYLVMESASKVVGYAYAGPYRPRPAYRNTVETSVYVAHWAHRRGFGQALLRALMKACEERGKRQLVAVIGDSAHVASIKLHEQAGFALVGTLKDVGYKHDRWLDSVIMQRSVGPGSATAPSLPYESSRVLAKV